MRIIRKVSLPADGERIMEIFAAAKKIMRNSGNMHQWGDGYPSLETVKTDVEQEGAYVVVDAEQIVGYFAFLPSPEPTYSQIYEGQWLDAETPYHVVHRIASIPEAHGVFQSIMDFCFSHDNNIRIDTHRDNHVMQHVISKCGFTYCGIIYLASGDERLAYQRISKKTVMQRMKKWLQSLSFRTGVIILLCCIPFYILSFAQMLLPISAAAKGVLWTVLFGLAKTCQYGGLTILGVEGYQRLKAWFRK